jgi:hypothetical protein
MVLDGTSPVLYHRLQNVSLILLSLVFLPLNTIILVLSLLVNKVFPNKVQQQRNSIRQKHAFKPRTILVTGVGMTKGLSLARLFHLTGHTVIGADFVSPDTPSPCGSMSVSLSRFHRLQKPDAKSGPDPYIHSLLRIIQSENVDLWVSCSGVASAVEDGMAAEIVAVRTGCGVIQFNVATTQVLHEKHSFIERTRSIGLRIPETFEITEREQVERILRGVAKERIERKFIMKTIGMDDSVRADMTLLPRPTEQETVEHLAKLKISKSSPWILQQYIKGNEYCTHALVVQGQVKAFVACPSAELLMHYEALPPHSPLCQAMLKFTKTYAEHGGMEFTGHLSFDFMMENENADKPEDIELYPIECNPRAHTAVALFDNTPEMVEGYLSAIQNEDGKMENQVITPNAPRRYYWIGHDLVDLLILPTLSFLTLCLSVPDLAEKYTTFVIHLLSWKDGTFEAWDPLPWWWLYHVYWPRRFWHCLLTGKKWSRINVSTTKMFEC